MSLLELLLLAALFCTDSLAHAELFQGASITPDLPFFVFGSDQATEVVLKEPTCLFMATNSLLDITKFKISSLFSNGSSLSVQLTEFKRIGDQWTRGLSFFCFPASSIAVRLDHGDLYKNVTSDSFELKSIIFLFMKKTQITDNCPNGNVVKPSALSISAMDVSVKVDCPVFVLVPTAPVPSWDFGNETVTNVPLILLSSFKISYNNFKLPHGVNYDLWTIQNGLHPLENPKIIGFDSESPPFDNQPILRSAVMITTNASNWVNVTGVQMDYLFKKEAYKVPATSSDIKKGFLDSDPYGFYEYDIEFSTGDILEKNVSNHIILDTEPLSEFCTNLTFTVLYLNNSRTTYPAKHGRVQFNNFESVTVGYHKNQETLLNCDKSGFRLMFSFLDTIWSN
ncbi:hypothetical protein L596_012187 [Steinernema carpocapsae]|uniref:Uncharacterized protein n=1 Tax=Steinernema carpocapsae TaxID=34508 RepID=A0A4U5NWN9_STECR|nr:hypothetical protein L596_012187 [Steinernema carpocapsae]